MTAGATTAPIIRSDTLPELRRVLEKLPALSQYLGDILQSSSFSTLAAYKENLGGVWAQEVTLLRAPTRMK